MEWRHRERAREWGSNLGKRSNFDRLPQDGYATPAAGAEPLYAHLSPRTRFVEPCAGEGRLVEHLSTAGHACIGRYDLPDDARVKHYAEAAAGTVVITNPPWARPVLHDIIVNLSNQAPTWLLIDADWVHTRQAVPYLPRLRLIIAVGRLKWIPGSKMTGKDNCAWHLFDRPQSDNLIRFVGRTAARPEPELKAPGTKAA